MPEDRSLEEFSGSGADGSDGDPAPAADESAGVTPAISTSTWTEGGADCERCNETAARRWRDGDSVVCADCKEW